MSAPKLALETGLFARTVSLLHRILHRARRGAPSQDILRSSFETVLAAQKYLYCPCAFSVFSQARYGIVHACPPSMLAEELQGHDVLHEADTWR